MSCTGSGLNLSFLELLLFKCGCDFGGTCELQNFTLNLRLVHDKVVVIPTALKLFPVTVVQTHVLVLRLMEGEKGCREATVTSISCQDGERFLLKYVRHYTLQTHKHVQVCNV